VFYLDSQVIVLIIFSPADDETSLLNVQ